MRRRWRRWRARRADSGEICHNRDCLRELRVGECWETVEHWVNTVEMGEMGGTFGVAYWCRHHKPAGARPFTP